MKYKGTLIVVKDCNRALKFYRDMFGLQLLQDNDGNMELTDHLYLQEQGYWEDFTKKPIISNSNQSELYFEESDIEKFVERLELFLFLVDGRIVVDHDIEGVAVFRLNGNELLIGGFVIQQIAGGGVALIVNRLPCGKRLCGRLRFRYFLRLRGLGHGKILLGVIRVGKGGQGEAASQHSTERQHGKHTDSFSLTHSQIPSSQ